MIAKPLLAIDVGSTKVACAIARAHPVALPSFDGTPMMQGLEILGCGLAEHPVRSTSWPCDVSLLVRTIEQALENTKVTAIPDRAIIVLSHPALVHARIMAQIDLADEPVAIRSRDLRRLASQAISQGLSLDRDVLVLEPLGYAGNGFERVQNPRGFPATRLSGAFQLVSMPSAVRKVITQAMEAVGVEVDRLLYGLQAIAASCVDERLAAKRLLLLDVGGCVTDMAIVERGQLCKTSSISWGLMSVAEALAATCRMTQEQAATDVLEGLASPTPSVKQLIESQLGVLDQHLRQLLKDEPPPQAAIVTGRGALMDGLVEWVGQATGMKATLGRSRRLPRVGDLAKQVGLTPVIGALELVCRTAAPERPRPTSSRLVNRLFDRTRTLLTEYF